MGQFTPQEHKDAARLLYRLRNGTKSPEFRAYVQSIIALFEAGDLSWHIRIEELEQMYLRNGDYVGRLDDDL